MAYTLITIIQRYIGTNAERVAMDTTGLKAGSSWFETDTSSRWVWSGSAWAAGSLSGGLLD